MRTMADAQLRPGPAKVKAQASITERQHAPLASLMNPTTILRSPVGDIVGCWPIASVSAAQTNVCFSNRPFGVKHFQTIRRYSVDVAHGLVLLFGIGTKALPSWVSKTRWNNLSGRPCRQSDGRSKQTCDLTSSIVPRGTSFHRRVELGLFSYRTLILYGFHAATARSLVQRNSVPSTQMRCRITANRRASATIAFFMPRRLAICIAQALSQDHFFERSML